MRNIINVSRFLKCTVHFQTTNFSNRRFCSKLFHDSDLKVNNVSLKRYIETLQNEYQLIKNENNINNEKRLMELQPIMHVIEKRQSTIDNLNNLTELLFDNDKEIQRLAAVEQEELEEKIKVVDKELLEALYPADSEDYCNSIVLEVNMGVGGQESMLFAKELFEMYCNFANYKGWNVQVAEYSSTDLGGIRHASALINGDSPLQYFQYEVGIHRVQRIPATEKSGRIHTSTVSVVALPQPTDIDVQLQDKDLKIETKRATGAGGQHVNTTDSAVRIVHLPTEISVECQVDRSQIKNRQIAMQRLKAKLYQQQLEQQTAKSDATRKNQVKSNFRNEKIRTYNYSQDRITDHRLQGTNFHNLKGFLMGGEELNVLIHKLHNTSKIEKLLNIVSEIENKW